MVAARILDSDRECMIWNSMAPWGVFKVAYEHMDWSDAGTLLFRFDGDRKHSVNFGVVSTARFQLKARYVLMAVK